MKLYLFELGHFVYPDIPLPLPVPGYLIQTDEGKNILVDTGFPESFISHPPAADPYAKVVRPQDYILNRISEIGLEAIDIDLVIVSHFDVDHAGNLSRFCHVETIVQRQQYEAAKAGHPRFASTQDQWDNALIRFRLIDGDVEIAPG
ncbi:MBL fold metallo-hydrolase [Dyadobacter koreensis]|uniref:MBL fold metallo-hydrolase n=1 Tax=Dyadobacter koreensis TaxID=408657 RepID=UPI000AD077BE|nr:MBL fold metallo-hydrolase [Dyadobacter koreensis]